MDGKAAMAQVMRSMRALTSVPSRVSAGAAPAIRDLIAQEFQDQTDPYGEPWAPHAASTIRKYGVHPILDLSGKMKQVTVAPLPGSGIGITLGASYSQYHQTGTGNMPARRILPDNRGLPADWTAAISALCQQEFGRAWRPV